MSLSEVILDHFVTARNCTCSGVDTNCNFLTSSCVFFPNVTTGSISAIAIRTLVGDGIASASSVHCYKHHKLFLLEFLNLSGKSFNFFFNNSNSCAGKHDPKCKNNNANNTKPAKFFHLD